MSPSRGARTSVDAEAEDVELEDVEVDVEDVLSRATLHQSAPPVFALSPPAQKLAASAPDNASAPGAAQLRATEPLALLDGIVHDTRMMRVVLDTNVVVSALRSRRGASFRLLSLLGTGRFGVVISVPLVLEYEYATLRAAGAVGLPPKAVEDVLDFICSVAEKREIFFLWRPFLKDPGDDLVLEVAVAGECDAIVTFNESDFVGVERFGIRVIRPAEMLGLIGEVP